MISFPIENTPRLSSPYALVWISQSFLRLLCRVLVENPNLRVIDSHILSARRAARSLPLSREAFSRAGDPHRIIMSSMKMNKRHKKAKHSRNPTFTPRSSQRLNASKEPGPIVPMMGPERPSEKVVAFAKIDKRKKRSEDICMHAKNVDKS